jgi:hypothetical protein
MHCWIGPMRCVPPIAETALLPWSEQACRRPGPCIIRPHLLVQSRACARIRYVPWAIAACNGQCGIPSSVASLGVAPSTPPRGGSIIMGDGWRLKAVRSAEGPAAGRHSYGTGWCRDGTGVVRDQRAWMRPAGSEWRPGACPACRSVGAMPRGPPRRHSARQDGQSRR